MYLQNKNQATIDSIAHLVSGTIYTEEENTLKANKVPLLTRIPILIGCGVNLNIYMNSGTTEFVSFRTVYGLMTLVRLPELVWLLCLWTYYFIFVMHMNHRVISTWKLLRDLYVEINT